MSPCRCWFRGSGWHLSAVRFVVSFRRGRDRGFPRPRGGRAGPVTVESSLWRLPAIRKLVLLTLLGFTGFAATLASLPWWAVHGGASPSAAGLVTTVMLGVTVVVQFLVPDGGAPAGDGPHAGDRGLRVGCAVAAVSAEHGSGADAGGQRRPRHRIRGVDGHGAALTAVLAPPARHGEAVGLYGLASPRPTCWWCPGPWRWRRTSPSGRSSCWRLVRCWLFRSALAIGVDQQPTGRPRAGGPSRRGAGPRCCRRSSCWRSPWPAGE